MFGYLSQKKPPLCLAGSARFVQGHSATVTCITHSEQQALGASGQVLRSGAKWAEVLLWDSESLEICACFSFHQAHGFHFLFLYFLAGGISSFPQLFIGFFKNAFGYHNFFTSSPPDQANVVACLNATFKGAFWYFVICVFVDFVKVSCGLIFI